MDTFDILFIYDVNRFFIILNIIDSRIEKQDLVNSVNTLQSQKTMCFVCGPSTMTDDVANWLYQLGIKKEYIKYEKWW